MTDRLLKTREVMAMLGVARSTIYEWIAAGKIPAPVKIGIRGDNRWWQSEIEAMGPAKAKLRTNVGLTRTEPDKVEH